jgi:uncharacterized protein (TIGR02001 family)
MRQLGLSLALLTLSATAARAADLAGDVSLGGSLSATTQYIYRGVAESGYQGAVQADLHASTGSGNFIGLWGSNRDRDLDPYADYDLEVYLGHRFALSSEWGVTLSARSHYFVGGNQETSDDYQELTGSLTYLDRWTLSVTSIPNAVRYWYDVRLSRSPAWAADTSAQWLVAGGFYLTGGAGYYYASGTGAGIQATGYGYGSVGIAYQRGPWRLDVGYFVTQEHAEQLFPYPTANDRFAGTVAWRF